MSSVDKLDKVATVARAGESDAARKLRRQQQAHDRNGDQLAQLQLFAEEYEERLRDMAANGMAAAQLQDYRRFLANLNDAINLQMAEVNATGEQLQARREEWIQKSMQTSALEDFIARRRVLAQEQADRREQREADERFRPVNGGDFVGDPHTGT